MQWICIGQGSINIEEETFYSLPVVRGRRRRRRRCSVFDMISPPTPTRSGCLHPTVAYHLYLLPSTRTCTRAPCSARVCSTKVLSAVSVVSAGGGGEGEGGLLSLSRCRLASHALCLLRQVDICLLQTLVQVRACVRACVCVECTFFFFSIAFSPTKIV